MRYAVSFLVFLVVPVVVFAARLTGVSDTITSSAPSASANHTIRFNTFTGISASGKIIITPEAGDFIIPEGLDYTDVDLSDDGADLVLGSSADSGAGSAVGVAVTAGTSGFITFTLNDTDSIAASSSVVIELGTNATAGATGDKQIQNPATKTSYQISIETQNASGETLDSGTAMIAIVEQVTVSGGNATTTEEEAAPVVSVTVPPQSGGSSNDYETNVKLEGFAPPRGEVVIVANGEFVTSTTAGPDAEFLALVEEVVSKAYTFSLYLIDELGRISPLVSVDAPASFGKTTEIKNIIIPPTIQAQKERVQKGEEVVIEGSALPNAEVLIEVVGGENPIGKTKTSEKGSYAFRVPTSGLREGSYTIQVRSLKEGVLSAPSLGARVSVLPKISEVEPPKEEPAGAEHPQVESPRAEPPQVEIPPQVVPEPLREEPGAGPETGFPWIAYLLFLLAVLLLLVIIYVVVRP